MVAVIWTTACCSSSIRDIHHFFSLCDSPARRNLQHETRSNTLRCVVCVPRCSLLGCPVHAASRLPLTESAGLLCPRCSASRGKIRSLRHPRRIAPLIPCGRAVTTAVHQRRSDRLKQVLHREGQMTRRALPSVPVKAIAMASMNTIHPRKTRPSARRTSHGRSTCGTWTAATSIPSPPCTCGPITMKRSREVGRSAVRQ
jgi:hypothetical protein